MEKIKYSAVIRFFVSKGLKAKQIYEQLLEVYKEFSEFKRDRTRLENDPREERPKAATTSEIIERVHNIIREDPRMNTSYFTWRITYEKAVWKISAAHVNNSTKTESKTNCQAELNRFIASFYNYG